MASPTQNLLISWAAILLILTANLLAQDESATIQTGSLPTGAYTLPPCTSRSATLRSVFPYPVTSGAIAQLRLLGLRLPSADDDLLTIRCALLDSAGNALSLTDDVQWTLHGKSLDGWEYSAAIPPPPPPAPWIERQLHIAVVIEASLQSAPYREILIESLAQLDSALGPYDSVTVVGASTTPTLLGHCTAQNAYTAIHAAAERLQFAGLNRLTYAMLWTVIRYSPTVLLVVSASNDHASLDVFTDDVLAEVRRRNIRVYCITVGENIEPTPLEILSTYSGGKCYRIFPGNSAYLRSAVVEAIRSEQVGSILQHRMTPQSAGHIAVGGTITLAIATQRTKFTDSLTIPPRSASNPLRQIIALFEKDSIQLDTHYMPIIETLSELLKANPHEEIELIAHAYREGPPSEQRRLALERARTVKAALIERGVERERIHLRALGDLKPLYPSAEIISEMMLNRRVELRWLSPALLPYELVVGYVTSERDALQMIELWAARGYNAYAEDVVVNGQPALRVKLWGYATRKQAIDIARQVQNRYNISVTIE
ncbi:MAG: OmpA family protein [Chlorobi bacterium]|nr:OmpA family protein [Chlorobiota bacterium]